MSPEALARPAEGLRRPNAPSGRDLPDREYEFLTRQFFMHASKIDSIHQERSALMRYAVIGTFGYFGWLFTHPGIGGDYAGNLMVGLSIWMVPFGFNLFGAWRNWFFLCAVRKHGGFLDHLLTTGLGTRNHFDDYKRDGNLEGWSVHPSVLFWAALLGVSLLTGVFGVITDQLAPAGGTG